MNPYLFQVVVAFLLVIGSTYAVTKIILELTNMPTLSDEEWELSKGTRPLTPEEIWEKAKQHQINLIEASRA
jgi:hypothetical protein